MPLVRVIREKMFPSVTEDEVKIICDDDLNYIQFGGYNFYPVEEKVKTLVGENTCFKWNMTTWVRTSGGYWEQDDVDEKDLGQFDSVEDCLAEIGRIDYENQIASISEGLRYEAMEKSCREYEKFMSEHPPEPLLCPHGVEFHECNACLVAGDMAYDAAREAKYFGRGGRGIGP